MGITATQFRKDLFTVLEGVSHGDAAEVSYKGATIRIVAAQAGLKLARAKRQHALLVDPESIVESDSALVDEMERKLAEGFPQP